MLMYSLYAISHTRGDHVGAGRDLEIARPRRAVGRKCAGQEYCQHHERHHALQLLHVWQYSAPSNSGRYPCCRAKWTVKPSSIIVQNINLKLNTTGPVFCVAIMFHVDYVDSKLALMTSNESCPTLLTRCVLLFPVLAPGAAGLGSIRLGSPGYMTYVGGSELSYL